MNWSLYNKDNYLEPFVFSNKKSQLDIVKEVIESIKEGHKIIFINGSCGSGKSTIALNLAKELGRTSIVVPVKTLQKQYQEDYSNKFQILKNNKEKLKITVIDGRNNHKCPYKDKLCDSRDLPCTIEIKKYNINLLEYYAKQNPFIRDKNVDLKDMRRKTVALACPYWSPIVPEEMDYNLEDAEEIIYKGLRGKKFVYYKRKQGCSYYDQFESYINSDVIIFNSRKYELENMMNRKPGTEIEIIDECDEFLDSLSGEVEINLDRLSKTLSNITNKEIKEISLEINDLVINLIKNPLKEISLIKNTKVLEFLKSIINNPILIDQSEEETSDYLYNIYNLAKSFEGFFDETYMSFSKNKNEDTVLTLVTINLEKKLKDLLDKNKVFVMMSGTLHSDDVLKNIFGLKKYKVIDAETQFKGEIIKKRTGNEKVFNYQFSKDNRELYLRLLSRCLEESKKPTLVHVNSFNDLPNEYECSKYNIINLKTSEELKEMQEKNRKGELLQAFKNKEMDTLYSTTCTRGVDLPGDQCNSIIFTKYPFPNINSLFWVVLKKSKPEYYNIFYFDKAKREFKQRIYRGVRSEKDKVEIMSPDLRIFREL